MPLPHGSTDRPGPAGDRPSRAGAAERPHRATDAETASRPGPARVLLLGGVYHDISTRALVMGILNRTPDSFFDRGAYFEMDAFLARAEQLVAGGADILDVGGVKAGTGPEVSLQEELDRVVPAVAALRERFGVPVSVDTWSGVVAAEAFAAGAVLGNDISGFADPDYLSAAAAAGAGVVATHIRLAPRVEDPDPRYDDVVAEVSAFLAERARRAIEAGVHPDSVIVDAGLDLGKTTEQSLALLGATGDLAASGRPVLLSASNKDFLGNLLNLEVERRRDASLAAVALGISLGCRVVRVHDVEGACRVRDALAAVAAAS